jgi:protocatechuate 3,4-dioxygenase beta subunit
MTQRCRAWPEQEEGPYHLDLDAFHQDVVEDRVGVPLDLRIQLVGADGSTPVNAAVVEIWQCDALGRYSGFPSPDLPMEENASSTQEGGGEVPSGERFLRGQQRVDDAGSCRFRTIYPGWYPGRTVHIHLRAAVDGQRFTSQMYFPDDVTDAVLAQAPYRDRLPRDTTNATDGIFPTGGELMVLDPEEDGNGYRAAICLILPGVGQEVTCS